MASSAPAAAAAQEAVPQPKPKADYTRSFMIFLRQDVVTLVPPVGILLLLFLSFFTWCHDTWSHEEATSFNLWQLGFSAGGSAAMIRSVIQG